jgi:hypothetical protein
MDETWLPVNKSEMKNVLKIAWGLAKDDDRREVIKICWMLLSKFQKGIGKSSLDCAIPQNASFEEGLRSYLQVAKIAQIEDEANRTELLNFTRKKSN